jgi:hypothetical protein
MLAWSESSNSGVSSRTPDAEAGVPGGGRDRSQLPAVRGRERVVEGQIGRAVGEQRVIERAGDGHGHPVSVGGQVAADEQEADGAAVGVDEAGERGRPNPLVRAGARDRLRSLAATDVGEAGELEQPVARLGRERLPAGAVARLGCVDPLEPELHARIDRGATDPVGAREILKQRRGVGNEADRVAVGCLALDNQGASQAEQGGIGH